MVAAVAAPGPRDALDLVLIEDVPSTFGHERDDDGLSVGLAAEKPGRVLAQVGIAPLAEAGEREPELSSLLAPRRLPGVAHASDRRPDDQDSGAFRRGGLPYVTGTRSTSSSVSVRPQRGSDSETHEGAAEAAPSHVV